MGRVYINTMKMMTENYFVRVPMYVYTRIYIHRNTQAW